MRSCPETDSRVHERTAFLRNNPARLAYLLSSERVARHYSWPDACTRGGHGHCTARIQKTKTPQADHCRSRRFRDAGGGDLWSLSAETSSSFRGAEYGMDRHGQTRADVAAGGRFGHARSERGVHSADSGRNRRDSIAEP